MMGKIHDDELWTIADSAELYGITAWGDEYFSISDDGEVMVHLSGGENSSRKVSLKAIAEGLKQRGMEFPVLLRFSDILDSRIKLINEEFQRAIKKAGYKGQYRGVYPIKVNQQQQVIEEIAQFGRKYHHGLEAGSKAELIAALAYTNDPEAYINCNGYKDEEFIDLALYGRRLGMRTILVVEMPGELSLILERARLMGLKPDIGIRMKPSTVAGGHWTESGGDRSVFGLNTAQVFQVLDQLRKAEMLDSLVLLHYHLGSQIPNIRDIRSGASEAARIYAGLVQEGAAMGLLDIGGGLAIDYDGSHTNRGSSRNYVLREYCDDIVEVVMNICDENEIIHPTIMSESGRALVAYYSVLLFNILDGSTFDHHKIPQELPEDVHELVLNLLYVKNTLTVRNIQECYNDLCYYREDVRMKFLHGSATMRELALSEQIYWAVLNDIHQLSKDLEHIPEDLESLGDKLSDIYYGNFSVFQSLPDAWAIDQLFPIMPIHRLNIQPERRAVLADITCDCDGKIDKFIGQYEYERSLPVHELGEEDYILGAFLVGAYQETLGDLHNLLGDTNVVSIECNDNNEIVYYKELEGDTVADVLSYVEYNPKELEAQVKRKAEEAVLQGIITPSERKKILSAYSMGMRGYTYYESDQED